MGTVFYTLEPIVWLESNLLFLGLPILIFIIKKYLKNFSTTCFLLSTVLLYSLFDHLQARLSLLPTHIITAGNIFGSSPFLGLANFGGPLFLTFFATAINALFVFAVINFNNLKSNKLNLNKNKKCWSNFLAIIDDSKIFLIIIAIIFLSLTLSKIQLNKNKIYYNSLPQTIKIGAVSNNENFDKDFSGFADEIFDQQEREIAAKMIDEKITPLKNELADKNLELVILPEDMIDIEDWNGIDEEAKNKFNIESGGLLINAYRQMAKELNINLSATFTTHQNNKTYNTMILFSKTGEIADIYNKSRLTFSSEYWPFQNWQPFYYQLLSKANPSILKNNAVFDKNYRYNAGKPKNLQIQNYSFAPMICLEPHYPSEIKKRSTMGANFITHTSSNRWITMGLKEYMRLTNNLRRIEAVWLKKPILFNGRMENAGIILPNGETQSINFETALKDYGIFMGEIKI